MRTAIAVLHSLRPPFLLLTPSCVTLGVGTAVWRGARLDAFDVVLLFIAATAAHASVNAFNEYFDFRSGLDTRTDRTPFSGGSGALIAVPDAVNAVFVAAVALLAITVGIGLWFVGQHGVALLPLGVIGVALIITYTQWLNGSPLLCLVAPGLGFGPLMVLGAHTVLAGHYALAALVASLVPFFLVSNLLLLNQFPDVEADRSVGRQHFVIAYGYRAATVVYGVFVAATFVTLIAAVSFAWLPPQALIALIPASAGAVAWIGARRFGDDVPRLVPYLAAGVIAAVLTPGVLGAALILT